MQNLAYLLFLILFLSCGKHETRRPLTGTTEPQAQEVLTSEQQAMRFIQTGDKDQFLSLIQANNLSINFQSPNGRTFLIEAVLWDQVEIVRLLLEYEGIDLEMKDPDGLSAYDHALLINNPQILALFNGDGLSQEEINQGLFKSLYALDYNQIQHFIIEGAELDIYDEKGMTPLTLAIFLKDERAVRILLQTRNLDVNLADLRRRWTPLTWATRLNLPRIVQMLQRMGASA